MSETVSVKELTPHELEPVLRRNLGTRAFLSGVGEVGKKWVIQAGSTYVEIIDDDKTLARAVSFTRIPDVLSLEVVRSSNRYVIQLPKDDPRKLLDGRYRGLIARHEGEILKHSYRQLVHISEVDLAMRPISDILSRVHNYGQFVPPAPRGGRSTERVRRLAKYTRFLTDIGFIRPEGASFVPGPNLPRGFATDTPEEEVYEEFLGRVLESSHQFLTEVLHLTMIKPFLRIENSYYWPAHQLGGLLRIKRERFGRVYSKYYGPRPPKFEGHLQSLIRKKGLLAEQDNVVGAPEIMERILSVDYEKWLAAGRCT